MNNRKIKATIFVSRIMLIALVILCSIASLACERNDYVIYEATGDADSVDITVVNHLGGTEQFNDVPLPWRLEFGGFEFDQPYMYVYNNGDSGSIRINIYINGKLAKTAGCSGPYANTSLYVDK
jgi:hypothetical protein